MTEKDFIQKGFKEGEKQWNERLLKEAKSMALATLEKIEEKKKEKAKVEEELRVLKLDLEDLKAGKIDKIQERQEKSVCAKRVSRVLFTYNQPWPFTFGPEWISGTYTTTSGNSYYL